MGSLSLTHILIVVIIFIIFFKPKRLSELGSAIGKTIKNFKQTKNEIEVEVISEEKKKP
jgi:sec-independent protein translocase protein TatA